MSRRMFEFKCDSQHVTESLVELETQTLQCSVCGETATRMLSTPRIALNGWNMHFPTAADRWARNHEEAARVAKSKSYYGETSLK